MSSSAEISKTISNTAAYPVGIVAGLVPFALSIAAHGTAFGSSASFWLATVSGIIFGALGLYALVKDGSSRFGMVALSVGAAVAGVSSVALML